MKKIDIGIHTQSKLVINPGQKNLKKILLGLAIIMRYIKKELQKEEPISMMRG